MTLGEKLQKLRKQKGMSQEQLASLLGISRQAVSRWELDHSLPDTENVVKLSKIFSVSADYLLLDHTDNVEIPSAASGSIAKPPRNFHTLAKCMAGAILLGAGCIGNIVLFILSTMIQVHVTKKRTLPNGSVQYYGGGDILGYSFWGFIEEYRLQALFIIFILLILVGIVILIAGRRKSGSTL